MTDFFHNCVIMCPSCRNLVKLPDPDETDPRGYDRLLCAVCNNNSPITNEDVIK